MAVLHMMRRRLGTLLTTIAKTIGGMSGAKTFDHDNARSMYAKRGEYRP